MAATPSACSSPTRATSSPLGSLDPVRAAPLADAGLTPYRAVRRAEPWLKGGARVLVIGCGGLGQFALQYLRLLPAAGGELVVVVAERSAARLERATELGADIALLDADAAAAGGPAEVVLDFVGTDETLALASDMVAPGGLVMLVGEGGGETSFGFERPAVEAWLTTTAWGWIDELRNVRPSGRGSTNHMGCRGDRAPRCQSRARAASHR